MLPTDGPEIGRFFGNSDHLKAHFFPHFPLEGVRKRLAEIQSPARKLPRRGLQDEVVAHQDFSCPHVETFDRDSMERVRKIRRLLRWLHRAKRSMAFLTAKNRLC